MPSRTLPYVAVAILVLATHAHAQSREQRNLTAQSQQQSAQDNRGTAQNPIVVKITPLPEAPDQARRDQDDRAEKANADWWTKVGAIGVIVVGLLQLGVFALQLVVFALQARRLRETVDAMRGGEMAQLRACVGIEKVEESALPVEEADEVHSLVEVTIKNFGQTPAYNVTGALNLYCGAWMTRLSEDFQYADAGQEWPEGIINFHAVETIDRDQARTRYVSFTPKGKEFFDGAKKRYVLLWVYGHIDYDDIYGRKWIRNFCYLFQPWAVVEHRFTPYDKHNDETCVYDPTKKVSWWQRLFGATAAPAARIS